MKAKYILLLAALTFSFIACEKQTPFDTQSEDDQPLILKPYNESGTGSFTYDLANPDIPLLDSVVVTPSKYTTINWYIDGVLLHTGVKIEMCFPAGSYALTIEAVTTKNKRTERKGSVTVHPYAADPYAAAPAAGRHVVPCVEMTLDGQNMDKVETLVIARDINGQDTVCTVVPTTKTADQLTYTLPEQADGDYYLFLKDAENKLYGSNKISVHNAAVALTGYDVFLPGDAWVITGAGLQNVASVTVDTVVITELTATATTLTLTAPAAEVGEHAISITNKDGSKVLFLTAEGLVDHATAFVSAETTIWTGPNYILWDGDRVRIETAVMAQVPVGSTIYIYYEELPEGHEGYIENGNPNVYHKMQIITATWTTLIDGFDVTAETPNPYSFVYTDSMKAAVDAQYSLSVVGWGLQINKITFK